MTRTYTPGTQYEWEPDAFPFATVETVDANVVTVEGTDATDAIAAAAKVGVEQGGGLLDTLATRLTSARAGYLDNLNVGGAVASQADITALNQSASRRIVATTISQMERPEAGSTTYQIEVRTYDTDGAAVNADSTPTMTATGIASGSLSANLGVASNPATGVYRWTYSAASGATLEQLRFDASATIGSATFTIAVYSQIVDFVAATWTTTDASHLTAIYDKLPSRSYLAGSTAATGAIVTADIGLAIANLDTQLGDLPNASENAAQVRVELAAELGRIDATIGSRQATVSNLSNAVTMAAKFDTMVVLDGAAYAFTEAALVSAPGITGDVTLAESQPHYAPLKAGQAVILTSDYDRAKTAATAAEVTAASADATLARKLLKADRYIDTTTTPWSLVLIEAGTGTLTTGTVLLRQSLKDVAGANVTTIDTFVGRSVGA